MRPIPTLIAVCSIFWAASIMTSIASARIANATLDLAGKTAVVVGGTSGIGRGIAMRLAQASASVTIVGRSASRGAQIVGEMEQAAAAASKSSGKASGSDSSSSSSSPPPLPPSSSPPSFRFVECNCFLLQSVADTAAALLERPVDLLVLSQGMATTQGFTPTAEGLDQKLALHVWSRAAFAKALLPALQKSADGRVLSVLSAGIHAAAPTWRADPELKRGYGIKAAADTAGFYNDIMVDSLARAAPEVTFAHAAPGFVNTNWGTEMPTLVRWAVRCLQPLGRSAADCGEYMVRGLTQATRGGFHLLDQYGLAGRATVVAGGEHEAAREAVWSHIEKVVEAKASVQE